MCTFCNIMSSIKHIICNEILQRIVRHRRMLLAVLFLGLEATSFVLDQIGDNEIGFLVAAFGLSIIGFLMTAYSASRSRSDVEIDRAAIELSFSIVQLIITYVYLSLSIFGVKVQSTIASIFPLLLAFTTLALAYKHNELVRDPRPNTPAGRDEEEGFADSLANSINGVVPSVNILSGVNEEEEITDSRTFHPPVDTSMVIEVIPDSTVLSVPAQPPTMVDEEETATPRISEQEEEVEIPEKSRASFTSSDTPIMSHEEIAIQTVEETDIKEGKRLYIPQQHQQHLLHLQRPR